MVLRECVIQDDAGSPLKTGVDVETHEMVEPIAGELWALQSGTDDDWALWAVAENGR